MYVSFPSYDIANEFTRFPADLESANAILDRLLYLSPTRNLLYVVDAHGSSLRPDHQLQHLGCFLAGLLALGAHEIPPSAFPTSSAFTAEHHMWAARGLGHTCWLTYAESQTGLGPERVQFEAQGSRKWSEVLGLWEKGGRVGQIPGLNEFGKPLKEEDVDVERGIQRDYFLSDPRYLLRPEVR